MRMPMMVCLTAAAIACCGSARAQQDDSPPSDAQLRLRVLKIAAFLRETHPPRRGVRETPGFAALIEGLPAEATARVAGEVAQDESLTALERRVAVIVAARFKNPERFARVDAYLRTALVPFTNDGPREGRPFKFHLKRLDEPALVHPDYRAAFEEFLPTYLTADGEELRKASPPGLFGPDSGGLRLDPAYALCWEEAVLRPYPWPVKLGVAEYLFHTGESASAATWAELLRQALGGNYAVRPVTKGLKAAPRREVYVALSEALAVREPAPPAPPGRPRRPPLENPPPEEPSQFQLQVGRLLLVSLKAEQELNQLRDDAALGVHARRLLEACRVARARIPERLLRLLHNSTRN